MKKCAQKSFLIALLLSVFLFAGCEGQKSNRQSNAGSTQEPPPSSVEFGDIELLKIEDPVASGFYYYNLKVTFTFFEEIDPDYPTLFLKRNDQELQQWPLTVTDIERGYVIFNIHNEIRENSNYSVTVNQYEIISYSSTEEFNPFSSSVPQSQQCNQPDPENPYTRWNTHNSWNGSFTSVPTDPEYIAEGQCRSMKDSNTGIEGVHCRPIQTQMLFYFNLVATAEGSTPIPAYSQVNVLLPDQAIYDRPPNGWPVVLYFHGAGSGLNCEHYHTAGVDAGGAVVKEWNGHHNSEAGAIYALIEAGYAVVLPHAPVGLPPLYHGNWITSVLEDNQPYHLTADYAFLSTLISHIDRGNFDALQHLDGNNLFAAGFSLGGTQSSRMSLAWPGRFRAIAIHNGGPANCLWVGYDDPEFPPEWCSDIDLPDLTDTPTPVLFTHQFEDRNQMVGQSELYAWYLDYLNQNRQQDQQPIPWRVVIGRFEQNLLYDWVLSQHPRGMTTHWAEPTPVPVCENRDQIDCVEYVEHIYVKDTYHYLIEEAGAVMVEWFNRYKGS